MKTEKAKEPEAQLLAVVRIRGSKETRTGVEETLRTHLRLTRKFHCSVFPSSPTVLGWLQLCKDYIAFAPVNSLMVAELKAKRGEGNPFRLAPPRGGFRKSTKLAFPRGELGKRTQESMEKLLRAMV